MNMRYHLKKKTEHAKYDVEMNAKVTECSEFNLIIDDLRIDSETEKSRYTDAILKGILAGLEESNSDYKVQINLITKEFSGETPPFGYEMCAKLLIREGLSGIAT